MRLLDADNAADYLREQGRVGADERIEVQFLSGGVSNVVLYVRRPDSVGGDFVLKQARQQLRVPQPWFCSVERIWREVTTLHWCERLLGGEHVAARPAVHLPRILFEDHENYAFGMTAAPLGHSTWKSELLDGRVRVEVAAACGDLLGRLHAASWRHAGVAQELDDRQFFDDLRLDPYYRQVARVHPDLQDAIERLLASVWSHRRCLVHGDFSPKNLLVWDRSLMLIDCEVGHYGDPAFDLGFFVTHLVLKAFHSGPRCDEYLGLADRFWNHYRAALRPAAGLEETEAVERRGMFNLAGCLLARVDGKSRVEYLARTDPVRKLARDWLREPPENWSEAHTLLGRQFRTET